MSLRLWLNYQACKSQAVTVARCYLQSTELSVSLLLNQRFHFLNSINLQKHVYSLSLWVIGYILKGKREGVWILSEATVQYITHIAVHAVEEELLTCESPQNTIMEAGSLA